MLICLTSTDTNKGDYTMDDLGTFKCPICGLTTPYRHDQESSDDLILQLGAALARTRRVARLWSSDRSSIDHPEWSARQQDISAADVALGAYFHWRRRKGLLSSVEQQTGNVDPDRTKEI